MNSHDNPVSKFSWEAFDDFFSITNIMKSQGEYQTLVFDSLKQITDEENQSRLIKLLDLRLITLLELINSYGGSYTDRSETLIFYDTIAARLEINNSICWSLGLPRKRRDRLAGLLEQYES